MSASNHAIPVLARRAKLNVLRCLTLRSVGLTLVAFLVAGGIYFRQSYKGFTQGLFNQMLYATIDENRNLWFCNSYWLEFMQKLSMNRVTGVYGFDGVNEGNLDDFDRGKLAYHRGQFAQAISLIQGDVRAHGETESKLFWLGMCYLRHAEAENCLSQLIGDSPPTNGSAPHDPHAQIDHSLLCALPLTQFHQRAESSRAAAKTFERLLDHYDSTNRLYQWLLNFSYMTINGFPQDVPTKYLIQSRFIASFYGEKKREIEAQFGFLSFEDRAHQLGVDTFNTGRGVAVEDFDKDGYLDIITGGSFEDVKYYHNDHGKRFIDRTQEVGLGGIKQPFVITAADYDNDGWIDVFFARPFGWYMLFRNNGDGTFTDVTAASGLLDSQADDTIAATWVAAWGDVDGDGDLDLFLPQWGFKMPFVKGLMAKPRMDSALFINEGGHFVNKTKEFGLADVVEDQYFIGAAFGDYDADGYPDLFLSSPLRNTSTLLRNVAGRRFEKTDLMRRGEGGFAAAFVDVNHDGRLDIFWAGFADAKTSTEQVVFGENLDRYRSGRSTIYLQTPDGRFEERADFFDLPMGTMGSGFGDLNNDGCYDFYLGTGTPESWFILPNLMYLGATDSTRCADRLINISMLDGFGTIQKGHGIVFFDFDNDGDQDVFSSLGGMWPADGWPNQFFVNNSQLENNWGKIRLRGRKTNYFGVGATIKVTAETSKHEAIVRYYLMDQGTGFGGAPYLAHIGLMNATRIKSVDVYWPVSKCWNTYKAELNRLNILDEGDCS